MANIKTVSLTTEEYIKIIEAIQQGFIYSDVSGKQHKFRPNEKLSLIVFLQANVGLRIGDILKLRLIDIVRVKNEYHFNDYIEQKTGKKRDFYIPDSVYHRINTYAMEKGISKEQSLFNPKGTSQPERAIQKQIAIVRDYLGMEKVSTHSFRKTYATNMYIESGFNIELTRVAMQHTSVITTQNYVDIKSEQLKETMQKVSDKLLIG